MPTRRPGNGCPKGKLRDDADNLSAFSSAIFGLPTRKTAMKSKGWRLSVGFVGFLRDEEPSRCEAARGDDNFVGRTPEADNDADKGADQTTASRRRDVIADSRHPLIRAEVRNKIESIEAQARRLGWPAELLWNNNFWDMPRGLASVLEIDDEIAEVTAEYIAILKTRSDLLKFRRNNA
jgi:hypothetical protein